MAEMSEEPSLRRNPWRAGDAGPFLCLSSKLTTSFTNRATRSICTASQGVPAIKFTFRVTVMSILLSLIVLTVAALGMRFYYTARVSADDLTKQILEQTAL